MKTRKILAVLCLVLAFAGAASALTGAEYEYGSAFGNCPYITLKLKISQILKNHS